MRTLIAMMTTGAATVTLVLALLYFWQSRLILLPGTTSGGRDALAQCGPGSAVWLEDGAFRGKVCEPAGLAKGTIVLFHGNAGTIDDRANLAAVLAARGFRVAMAEYPGYGKRDGKATIRNVLAASLDDFTRAQSRWPAPLYLLGESFGAGIAAEVIRKHGERVAGAVLITPWDSLANVVNTTFPVPLSFLLQERFDTADSLSTYRGNVVIVAAEQDEVIPVGHARALAKAAPAASYLELRGAGHNNWLLHMTERDWDRVAGSLIQPH